jgi:thioester reductase-like protein
MGKTAMMAGATGLVGEHLLELLLRDPAYAKVIALGRRGLAPNDSKLEQILIDFDELQSLPLSLHVDDVFCSSVMLATLPPEV